MRRAIDWLQRIFRGESGRRELLIFFALLAAVFYLDKLLLGPFAPVRLHDVFDSDFFRYRALSEYGPLAQWYPNYAGGMPAYAWHHTPLYVLVLLSAFLPPWLIYSALVLVLMFCAGWGMFRLLEEHAGLPRTAAVWGGAFFALASQVQQNSIPSTVFNYAFPLFFCLFIDAYRARRELRRLLPPLLGLNAILALSYPVLTLPYFPLVQLLLLFVFSGQGSAIEKDRRGLLAWYFVLWAGYVLACSPVLYSLLQYIPLACKRGEHAADFVLAPAFVSFLKTSGLMLVSSMARAALLVPAAAGLGLAFRSPRLRLYYIALAAVALISGFYSSEISALLRGSILLKMDLGHFFWTLPFLGALAASTAAGLILRGEKPGLAFQGALLGFAVLAGLAWAGLIHKSTVVPNVLSGLLFLLLVQAGRVEACRVPRAAAWGALLAGAAAAAWGCRVGEQSYLHALLFLGGAGWLAASATALALPGRRTVYWAMLLSVLFTASLRFARNKGEEPESDRYLQTAGYSSLKDLRNSAEPVRTASFGLPPFPAISQGLETADARGPVFSGRYKDYFKLILSPQLSDKKHEDFFDNYWYNLYFHKYTPAAGLNFNLARAAGINYILSPTESELLRAESDGVTVFRSDLDLAAGRFLRPLLQKSKAGKKLDKRYFSEIYAYRLKGAFARAYLVPDARLFSGSSELLSALSAASPADLEAAVYLERADSGPDLPRVGFAAGTLGAKVVLVSFSSDRAVYRVSSRRPALLVLNNNYHPAWTASVNGRPARVYRANHAFMAAAVPAGQSETVFEFKAPGLRSLWLAAAAGILLVNALLAVAAASRLRRGGQVV